MQLFTTLLVILCITVQVKAIIDIIKKISDQKGDKNSQNILLAWLLIVLFFSIIGAILYFKLKRDEYSESSKN